jgi:alpha-glucosidase/alpha-D-xyloside xylohydrolase
MSKRISRREVLRVFGSAGAGAALGAGPLCAQESGIRVGGRSVEIAVSSISPQTVRISLAPIENGRTQPIKSDGSLVEQVGSPPAKRFTSLTRTESVRCGELLVKLSPDPPTIRIEATDGRLVQQLRVDQQTGVVSFLIGNGPLLGLGEIV